MAYNKINYGGRTLIDLTADTVEAAHVLDGKQFHGADGEIKTGAMTNRGAVEGTIATAAGSYSIPAGYHNGSGSVQISPVEQSKVIAQNIKQGVQLLGVTGSYAGEPVNLQTKTKSYTPSTTAQSESVSADSGYDGLGSVSVTVAAIPYTETENPSGGITVTIG